MEEWLAANFTSAKATRLAIQVNHCDANLVSRIENAVIKRLENALSEEKRGKIRTFSLVTTDNQKICTDYKHAAHYQANALIHIGESCRCNNTCSKTIPTIYMSLQDCLGEPSLARNQFPVITHDMKPTWIVFGREVDWKAFSRNEDLAMWDDENLSSDLSSPAVGLLASFYDGSRFWHAGSKSYYPFLKHQGDDGIHCGAQIELVCIGTSNAIETIIRQRYYGCISKDQSFCLASRNYSKVISADKYKRIGLLFNDTLCPKLDELRRLIKEICRREKRVVIQIACDTINEAKLENFPTLDCFCYVGCPIRTIELMLGDPHLHRRPIFTPWEVMIMFGEATWSPHMIICADEVLNLASERDPVAEEKDEDDDRTMTVRDVSVINGGDLAVTGNYGLVPIASQTWKGVEGYNIPEDVQAEQKLYQGLSGIASSYVHESR